MEERMEYIVLDLEWNQSNTGKEDAVEKLPFEIIEIGAIKLNKERVMVSEFNELIKPHVYHEMHKITSKLIHIQMQELERGRPFPEVGGDFVRWCGQEEQLFCTWGTLDLTELQRNMAYYEMPLLAPGPLPYLDVQKLFAIAYEERKIRRNLEYAIDFLHIEKDIPFHRAFSDAYYTAKILIRILEEHPEVVVNLSYDTFCPPKDRGDEVKAQFDTYVKYISREFKDKTEAFADKEVVSSKCYLCHRNLRKKIKWFSANGRHYYCVAYCEKHGYLKGKIRVRKGKRKEQYFEQDLKIEHTKINKETGERIVVPSREDSFERLLEAEKQFAEDGNSVEDEVIHTIMVEKLQQTLKMLSEEENTIIQALFYENLSETELAKRLGIARTTLQSRKYKILEKLKEYFHY